MRVRRTLMIIAFLTAAVITVLPAKAGALDKTRVAADAQWLVHLNMDAIVKSQLYSHMVHHAAELHIEMDELDEMKTMFGVDPRTDLKDAIIYGSGNPEDGKGVIVLTTTAAMDGVIPKLKEMEAPVKEITAGSRTLHSVQGESEGESLFFHIGQGRVSDERIVVLGQKQERVLAGLDVIEGKAANLASAKDSALNASKPGAGSMVFIAAIGLSWLGEEDKDDPASKILQSSSRLSLDMGEDGADAYTDAMIAVKSAEDATNISDMLRGLMAVGRLAISHEPKLADVKPLFESIKCTTSGNDVRVSIRYPTEKLVEFGRKLAEMEHHDGDGRDEDEGGKHEHKDKDSDADKSHDHSGHAHDHGAGHGG